MKRVLVTLAILALFPLLAGCDLLGFRKWEWQQKLVLEVETPRGTVTGGGVVKVTVGSTPEGMPFEGGGGMGSDVEGEASFVEVTPGRYLFALLSGGGEAQLARSVFFGDSGRNNTERNDWLQDFKGSAAVSRSNYPRFATFTDISDPTTVRRVDPDDLAASFGTGYALKSVMLEITDEPVTKGEVAEVLGWLGEYPEPGLCPPTGRTTNIPFCRRVHHGDFIRR
jgi:hypothetical protein